MGIIDAVFYVRPITIIDSLSVWNSNTQVNFDRKTVSGDWIYCEITAPNNYLTLKATGYNDLEIRVFEGGGGSENPDKCFELVSQSQNLYAWKVNNYTIYTLTSTPVVNTRIYKADGTLYADDEFNDGEYVYHNYITSVNGSSTINLTAYAPA